jgi:hypothetical protein
VRCDGRQGQGAWSPHSRGHLRENPFGEAFGTNQRALRISAARGKLGIVKGGGKRKNYGSPCAKLIEDLTIVVPA